MGFVGFMVDFYVFGFGCLWIFSMMMVVVCGQQWWLLCFLWLVVVGYGSDLVFVLFFYLFGFVVMDLAMVAIDFGGDGGVGFQVVVVGCGVVATIV